ncbi:MAG: hypothetical protein IKP47_00720 [Ruminococcus sp.]|nr:hypothetical protein [Ruminococcus sp.]
MGLSLQLRESIQELLFTDKYETDDSELLIERRFAKKNPLALNPRMPNPLFKRITHLMGEHLDFAELRDLYFSAELGEGVVMVFPFKDTEYFMALDLHRDRLEKSDAVTLAIYCDARKYVLLHELFELLQKNSEQDFKPPLNDAPLVKAVLESDGKYVFYKGDRIPVASKALLDRIRKQPGNARADASEDINGDYN